VSIEGEAFKGLRAQLIREKNQTAGIFKQPSDSSKLVCNDEITVYCFEKETNSAELVAKIFEDNLLSEDLRCE